MAAYLFIGDVSRSPQTVFTYSP